MKWFSRLVLIFKRPVYCNECLNEPVCDFCKHYNFNGKGGIYVGNGFCTLHQKQIDPEGGCNNFHCKNSNKSKT